MSDEQQYSLNGILRYEWIFGHGFLGYGEPDVTRELISALDWPSGTRVLDVGSGLGGPDFLMAADYQARVTGVDLTEATVQLARERQQEQGISGVEFVQGDIQALAWEPAAFDVIWSRETLLHLPDKAALFQKFFDWLSPGGSLVITDYARRQGLGSESFEAYVRESGYPLLELDEYAETISRAGFRDTEVQDKSADLIRHLENHLHKLEKDRAAFCRRFSEEDYEYIKGRWQLKCDCCREGDMKWGWFLARKPV
jgi:phosphoethanolamine N-methyltransferase